MGPAIDRTHLSLADAKGDAGQVGNNRRIFHSARVSKTGAAAQEFDVVKAR